MTENLSKLPTVSVVMPVRNEADFIERSLGAVLTQNYPPELLEIIIADGNSTDATGELIEKLKSQTNISIKTLENPRKIAPTGLNLAIKAARGAIIVRVDGHCEIAPDYVENCVRHLSEGKAECVGGPIETIGENLTARAIAAAMSSRFGVGGSAFRCVDDCEMLTDTVAFPALKREIFQKIGYFNEELVRNQDDEFSYRLRKSGGRILLAPDIRSRYYSRGNLRSLWRQYFQYGFWKVRVLQMHPKQMRLRQFVPFVFVAAAAFSIVPALLTTSGKWAFVLFLSAYLLAASAAATSVFRRVEFAALPVVLASFVILHFSYGLGFCAGLIKFYKIRLAEKPNSRMVAERFDIQPKHPSPDGLTDKLIGD